MMKRKENDLKYSKYSNIGSLAIFLRPMTFCPCFTAGLAFSISLADIVPNKL